MRSWEDGPKCPSGEHELEGPWVRFCHPCGAYVDDIAYLVEQGAPAAEAVLRAREAAAHGKAIRLLAAERGPAAPPSLTVVPGDSDELEETVRTRCTDFLELMGFRVYKLEQGYRPDACLQCGAGIPVRGSRQALGLADILVAGPGILFFVEFKRPKQKKRGGFVSNRSPEQLQFERDCKVAGVSVYLWRSIDDAQAWFESWKGGQS